MITVSLSITEGAVTTRVRVRATSLGRALELAGYGDGRKVVRVTNPMPVTEVLDMQRMDHTNHGAQTPEPNTAALPAAV